MELSSEDKLILKCLGINSDAEAYGLLSHRIDWDYVLKSAYHNGVSSLLYKNLKKYAENGLIPKVVFEALKDNYRDITARNLFLREELKNILNAFNSADKSIMPLKGMALLDTVYRDIGLRPVGDIDILVKKEEIKQSGRILEQLGFSSPYTAKDYIHILNSRYLNSVYYLKERGDLSVLVHLHWNIINTTVPVNSYYKRIKISKFWEEVRVSNIAGVEALVMSPHHLIIHLSEHMLRHSYDRYILFSDVCEVIEAYDKNGLSWESLVSDSVDFNITRPVYYCLYLISKLLNARVPKDVLEELRPASLNALDKRIERLALDNSAEARYLMLFSLNKKFSEKVMFILDTILPNKEDLALRYSVRVNDINIYYYLKRLANIFTRGIIFGRIIQI